MLELVLYHIVLYTIVFCFIRHNMKEHEKEYHGRWTVFEEIKVKYFQKHLVNCKKYPVGDWIDLRAAETVTLEAGEVHNFKLGVAMEIPEGYEAVIVARSSTLEQFGIISPNGMSVIDHKYKGDGDEWHFPAIAVRNTTINFNDRICQFRIQKRQPEIFFTEVEKMEHANRGGFGSTGKN